MGSCSRRRRSSIWKALKKPANNAVWTTNQFSAMSKGDKTHEDEYCIHLFKPFLFAFAVDDPHSCLSRISGCAAMCMWLDTCLRYNIPKQSWRPLVLLGNTSILDIFFEGDQREPLPCACGFACGRGSCSTGGYLDRIIGQDKAHMLPCFILLARRDMGVRTETHSLCSRCHPRPDPP